MPHSFDELSNCLNTYTGNLLFIEDHKSVVLFLVEDLLQQSVKNTAKPLLLLAVQLQQLLDPAVTNSKLSSNKLSQLLSYQSRGSFGLPHKTFAQEANSDSAKLPPGYNWLVDGGEIGDLQVDRGVRLCVTVRHVLDSPGSFAPNVVSAVRSFFLPGHISVHYYENWVHEKVNQSL